MGNVLITQSYRLGQVAAAIGVKEQALRNWFYRGKGKQIDLFAAAPEGGWRSFSEEDVYVLGVIAQLVKFGCPVINAVDEARTCLGAMNFRNWEGRPDYIYAAPCGVEWRARADEGMLWAVCGRGNLPTVVKINVPMLFAEIRRRLAAELS